MLAQLGTFSLILATVFSALMVVFGAQVTEQNSQWRPALRRATCLQVFFTVSAFVILVSLLVRSDFSVAYVVQHSNLRSPLFYKITAAWGAHEGSLLLWNSVLSLWALSLFRLKQLPAFVVDRTLAVQGILLLGFSLFTLLTSSPFVPVSEVPLNGMDLNPVLQDPAMVIHPPILYVGYVGFSVPFSLVVAMLWVGQTQQQWLRWIRPWVVIPWIFLTIGITLGSWWAYYELGWGGWWFWDPVENASLMPWIAATALIHSLAVTEKRGLFLHWTLLLAVMAFAFSVLGSFLVRSGVLISVHSFASDPTRGMFILAMFAVFVGGALGLYALKTPIGFASSGFKLFSREALLLLNNLLLIAMLLLVMLGTLYPLVVEAMGWGKISVGPPYFDHVMLYVTLPLLLAIGLGQRLNWKGTSKLPTKLAKILLLAFALAVVTGLIIAIPLTDISWLTLLAIVFALWVLYSAGQAIVNTKLNNNKLGKSQIGMFTAHIGVAVFALGVALSNQLAQVETVPISPGDTRTVGQYSFHFSKVQQATESNYQMTQAVFDVKRHSQPITSLTSEKRFYPGRQTSTTEAGIKAGFIRDLYVTLGEQLPNSQKGAVWSVRFQVRPFVRWIWLGCLLMALGGLIAILDKRYRVTKPDSGNLTKNGLSNA
ncbi:MAG: heme lyase CcmF/NrfE family subunit [Gammaproteobacteria bacterium]|nr:heme lyase CcmF/NrfE family subunit [Gammaproteobacteria bacterium]NNC98106.1 heme lyase CcmF/NrfE family subunit [Gammaproteobacteria bacterium]NNM13170.1 heme lyase CcmF/NrfE family subunit [Gammaproteobacteria bacterium]